MAKKKAKKAKKAKLSRVTAKAKEKVKETEAKKKAEAEAKKKAKAEAKKAKAEAKAKKTPKKAKGEIAEIEEKTISKKAKVRVISVDDEEVIRTLLKKVLTKAGYEVSLADSGEAGLKVMKNETFDLAIIDLKMPGMGGLAFLGEMKELYPDTEAVILTGFGDIDTAVDAMKKGAFNFVPKPFKKETFLTIIERALERRLMKKEMEEARAAMRDIENEAAKKIGKLEGQLNAVEEAKRELGQQFNDIKKSLMDGTGKRADLEKKVVALERVAGQIKAMEEKLVETEKDKKEALKKSKKLEKELSEKVSGNVELGNKLDDAKASLENLKEEVVREKKDAPSEDEAAVEVSLGDIHQALAEFRNEIG